MEAKSQVVKRIALVCLRWDGCNEVMDVKQEKLPFLIGFEYEIQGRTSILFVSLGLHFDLSIRIPIAPLN